MYYSKNLKKLLGIGVRVEERMWDGLLIKMWFRGFVVKIWSLIDFNFGVLIEEENFIGIEVFN